MRISLKAMVHICTGVILAFVIVAVFAPKQARFSDTAEAYSGRGDSCGLSAWIPGGCPRWVGVTVYAPDDAQWVLFCPHNPYSCDGITGTGSRDIAQEECGNYACAGAGNYRVHLVGPQPAGYTCGAQDLIYSVDPYTNDTFYPPHWEDVGLELNCTPTDPGPGLNPTVTLTADSQVIHTGQSVALTWTSSGAEKCKRELGSLNPTWATSAPQWTTELQGTFATGPLSATTSYKIVCRHTTQAGVNYNKSKTIAINVSPWPPPTVTLSATSPVAYGASSLIQWTATNATSCTAKGAPDWNWTSAVDPLGSGDSHSTVPLTANNTYTLQCIGPGGTSALMKVSVVVTPPALASACVGSTTIPSTMTAEEVVAATVTMKNTGSSPWTSPDDSLVLVGRTGANASWIPYTVDLPSSPIITNQNATFTFNLRAPKTPGTYDVRYRMIRNGVAEYDPQCGQTVTVVAQNNMPIGSHDTASCALGVPWGWTSDPDTINPIHVHIYLDAPYGKGGIFLGDIIADGPYAGHDGYGFAFDVPEYLRDGIPHTYYAYAIDIPEPGFNPMLTDSPQTIACSMPPIVSVEPLMQPDYCIPGAMQSITWKYQSDTGTAQAYWQLQASKDPLFSAIDFDSLKTEAIPPSQSSTGIPPDSLTPATAFYTRMKSWDALGSESAWSNTSIFTTPSGPYPTVVLSMKPMNPIAKQDVEFTDITDVVPENVFTREWNFGDGTIITENPGSNIIIHQFSSEAKDIKVTLGLSSKESQGNLCYGSISGVQVKKPLPMYKEIKPGVAPTNKSR